MINWWRQRKERKEVELFEYNKLKYSNIIHITKERFKKNGCTKTILLSIKDTYYGHNGTVRLRFEIEPDWILLARGFPKNKRVEIATGLDDGYRLLSDYFTSYLDISVDRIFKEYLNKIEED